MVTVVASRFRTVRKRIRRSNHLFASRGGGELFRGSDGTARPLTRCGRGRLRPKFPWRTSRNPRRPWRRIRLRPAPGFPASARHAAGPIRSARADAKRFVTSGPCDYTFATNSVLYKRHEAYTSSCPPDPSTVFYAGVSPKLWIPPSRISAGELGSRRLNVSHRRS